MNEELKFRTRNIEVSYEMLLGERLKWHRLDQQMTQTDLAIRTGLAQATISRMERGACALTILDVRTVCHALGTTLGDVVRYNDMLWDAL